jgi:hypothetical protein
MEFVIIFILLLLLGIVVSNTIGFFTGAPFAPTPKRRIKELLAELKLNKKDVVFDLGSGDGRLLLEVSRTHAKAVGFEINPFLFFWTKYKIRNYKNTEVSLADFWNQDFSRATVIFAFILPEFMKGLSKKLADEVKPGTRVVTYLASLPGQRASKSINGLNIYKF